MGKSKNDTIMDGLVTGGYITGSISDRERKRLLTLLGLSGVQSKSLYDLYKLAGERPRL